MSASYRTRRRRRAGFAALVGGAIAAVLLQWLGLGPAPSSAPKKPPPIATPSAPAAERSADRSPDLGSSSDSESQFSFYTLALTLAPAFCQLEPDKKQCLAPTRDLDTPLTLHGLWPDHVQRKPSIHSAAKANIGPANCSAEPLANLEQSIDPARLRRLMPGFLDGLAAHEWRKHGSCSGLSSVQYFAVSLDWTERMNAALTGILRAASGKQISAEGLRTGAEAVMPGLAQALTLHCRNIKTHGEPRSERATTLLELRVCLAKDAHGAPIGPTECAALDRIDQGCGRTFRVLAP